MELLSWELEHGDKFIDTKRFSPVVYEDDVPREGDIFFTPYDQITNDMLSEKKDYTDELWWRKQEERCRNGYTVKNVTKSGRDIWIAGRHYLYLNFWFIKRLNDAGTRKEVLHPRFTDLSYENWQIRNMMQEQGKDNMWVKCRQRGISEEEACDSAAEFMFVRDSQVLIVGGEDFYNENTMMMVKRGLERMKNTQFYKEIKPDRQDYIKARNFGSEVYSITARNNAQSCSGKSPSKVKLEEIGIWKAKLVRELAEFLKPSMEAEGKRTGVIQYIGTGGEIEDGVGDMEKMAYDPDSYNLLSFENKEEECDDRIARFIPADKFEIIDEDGNSLRSEAMVKLMAERKSKNLEERYRAITQKPIKLSEVFFISTGGYFGEAISQACNERKAYINNHREEQGVERCRLEWKDPNDWWQGVDRVHDENGWLIISEKPKKDNDGNIPDNLYRAGTDSYDQDEAHTSSSKGCCCIKKGFYDANESYYKYVALILERPTTAEGGAEVFYEHTAMASMYYNVINLIEHSKLRIIYWYINNNLSTLLKLRPAFVTANMVVNSKTVNKYGIDSATKPHWLAMQKDYLRTSMNIESCDFIELLDAWAKFKYDPSGKRYNCDVTIATSLCTVCEEDEKEMMMYEKDTEEEKSYIHYTSNKRGGFNIGVR